MQRVESSDFRGTARFQLVRRLGHGGMGVVYEAFDKERGERVALKTLRVRDPKVLFRFKKEFRAFQDLQHPNLVSLGELYSDGVEWFFTMELVDGCDFLEYVRPLIAMRRGPSSSWRLGQASPDADTQPEFSPARRSTPDTPVMHEAFDQQRLRASLIQLAQGLIALHDAQVVHRDIKPSNILVSRTGRLVLLDYGLATDQTRSEQLSEGEVVGTADYMAPEQAAAKPVGPAADWYSVGVILYEALTGRIPFSGPTLEVMMAKQRTEPAPPSRVVSGLPGDLDELTSKLLRFDPAARPTGRDVLALLGAAPPVQTSAPSLAGASHTTPFIGRTAEVAVLNDAFDRARKGEARAICVTGESGVGKTALVRHFTEGLAALEGETVVLHGRCYERESVPYKAVDGVVDSLSRYMLRLPKAEAAGLLPRKASLLADVFPVLASLEAVAEAPRPQRGARDPQEQRSQLFSAMRELLARLADRRPVVLVIDDLQWADADSLALLGEVLSPPEAPGILLVATVRTKEGAERSVAERAIESLAGEIQRLEIHRLPPEDACELANLLLRRATAPAGASASAIAQEAGGHPLFIDELVRHACATSAPASAPVHLEEALWSRIGTLEEPTRRLLELVTLAGGPLMQRTAAHAGSLEFADFSRRVSLLRAAHLVRTTGTRGSDLVEAYHDRIRAAVLAHLTADVARRHHGRLAVALEISGQFDFEALAVHWCEAGDRDKAADYAERAAHKADRALAFDRAARLYQMCLDLLSADDRELRRVRIRLAESLVNAGRGAEAAQVFLTAAAEAAAIEALDLRRRAAEQLLISGHIDEGQTVLRTVLSAVDMELARTPKRALASLLARRIRVRLRGLRFKERDPSQLSVNELTRVDICWSVAIALGLVDTVRGADFQSRNLLLSLRTGEPYRIARALAMEGGYAAVMKGSSLRSENLLGRARELAERVGHPHARGLSALMTGVADFLSGRWEATIDHCRSAEAILREGCTGVTWELDNARLYPLWAQLFLGRMREMENGAKLLLKEAVERGDLYLAANLRTRLLPASLLATGAAEAAAREAAAAIEVWSRHGFHMQHYFVLLSHTEADLYLDQPKQADDRLTERWPHLVASKLLYVQTMRLEALHLRGRAMLATLSNRAAVGEVQRIAKKIRAERAGWATPLADLLLAGCHYSRSEDDRALSLVQSARSGFETAKMAVHAAVAMRREGELVGGEAGEQLRSEADCRLRECGIREPVRMAAVIAPGFQRARV